MRIGKYTLRIHLNENETILYNLITKVNFKVPVKNDERLILKYIKKNLKKIYSQLRKRLIIVNDKYDDYSEFIKIKDYYNNQNIKGTFLIHTNLNCNLKCSYCYQSCIKNKQESINDDNIDKIIDFIYKTVKMNDYRILDICFIGGEPLLQSKKILMIADKVNKLQNVKISYTVVTNGTIYNEKIYEKFIKRGIINFQITLDGTEKIHDKLRIYKNNKGSHKVIINNLIKMQNDFSNINTIINCNINELNKNNIEDMIFELKQNNIKYPISFSLVFDNIGNEKYETNDKKIWLKSHKTAMKYGYEFEPFYREMYLGCAMTQKNYHILSPSGNLYKCINAINDNEYYVSNLSEYGTNLYYENASKFFNYFPNNKLCKNCEILPICYGGCHYKNRNKEFKCDKELYYLNDIELIKEMYKE